MTDLPVRGRRVAVAGAAVSGLAVARVMLDRGARVLIVDSRDDAAMRESGITRPFAGDIEDWHYRPPDDTARAGAALRRLIAARLSQREERVQAA